MSHPAKGEPSKPSPWPLAWVSAAAVDAPLVCVGWLWLLASEGHAVRPLSEGTVLGFSVWLAYMADRWFDGWRLKKADTNSFRHRYVLANRTTIGIIWSIVLIVTVIYAVNRLPPELLRRGSVLLAVVLVYFGAIHLGPRWLRRSVPKEIATALILVSGMLLFLPSAGIPIPALAAIALLFFANCALIGEWESEADLGQGFGSMADRIPSSMGFTRMLLALSVGISAFAATGLYASEFRLVWLAAGLSSLLLLLLDLTQSRWNLANLRSMADIALMTPWLVLLV